MKRLWVKIDLERLRQHLSAEDKEGVTAGAVLNWLREAGFEADGEGWLIGEHDLGQLQPDEVTEVEERGEMAGKNPGVSPLVDDRAAKR